MRVQIVSFNCILKNKLGEVLSSSVVQDVTTTAPASENVLPGLVRALQELKCGEEREVFLRAEEAYGFYNPALAFDVDRDQLSNGKRLKVGDTVRGHFQDQQGAKSYRVVSCDSRSVALDANHPLAGQDLVFKIKLTASREEMTDDLQDWFVEEKRLYC
jgi:FKBP-type peptidyl-prolyl cis-trans isomerase SlyD